MMKKKTLARICAMIAVALIVASLAIPAFADTSMTDAQIKAFAYNSWYHSVQSMRNSSFDYFLARTTLTPEDEIFEYDIITSSNLTQRINIDFATIGSENVASSAVTFGSYEYVIDFLLDGYSNTVQHTGYIVLIQGSIGGVYDAKIRFYEDESDEYMLFEFDYDVVTVNGVPELQLKKIRDYTGVDINEILIDTPSQIVSSSVTIASKNFAETNLLMLATLLYGSSQNKTTYPKTYYQAYATAFDADSYTDAFNDGYETARNEITSGEFGKNLIGTIISAPFDALRNFTLIEWDLSNGGTVTITLASIVSAGIGIAVFVWFLKMFAGG